MTNSNFRLSYACPICKHGKIYVDGIAKLHVSIHCPDCKRPFVVDLQTGRCEPGVNIRNKNRRK